MVISALSVTLALAAPPPWQKLAARQWGSAEVERVLNQSPWAQASGATFPDPREPGPQSVYELPGAAQAGLPAPKNAATDGHWSGGVARNNGRGMLPTLSVLIRWDSALPVRQAMIRAQELHLGAVDPHETAKAHQEPTQYILTVMGLIPANQYKAPGTLPSKSSSETDEGTRPAMDTEQVLEGLMSSTLLRVRGKAPIRPENVRIDAESGTIHVFFPRSLDIKRSDKEAVFTTRFGSLVLEKRFRLSEMVYQKQLEL